MAPRKKVISRLFVSVSTALWRQRKSTGRQGLLCTKRVHFSTIPIVTDTAIRTTGKNWKCFSTKWSHCILPKKRNKWRTRSKFFNTSANVHVCNRWQLAIDSFLCISRCEKCLIMPSVRVRDFNAIDSMKAFSPFAIHSTQIFAITATESCWVQVNAYNYKPPSYSISNLLNYSNS